MALQILLTIFLVLLNGFFVAAEFAMVKVRASQIELRARKGSGVAKTARHMLTNLNAYLSATQLGITLASLGLGWIGEEVVHELVLKGFHRMGLEMSEAVADSISIPIAFGIITVAHIVFGELAPKSLAIQRSETTTLFVAVPMKIFYYVFLPFIWLLNGFANIILKLMGIDPSDKTEVHSPDELLYILEQSKTSGVIHSSEHRIIENVFDFTESVARQIMIPRTDMTAINGAMPTEQILDIIVREGFSRYPVYQETVDNITGVVHAKDILRAMQEKQTVEINELLRPAYFVPETKKINDLLRELQLKHSQLAVIVDEFGGTSGIVTLEDILEELVGDIQDEHDEELPVVERISDTEFRVNGSAALRDVSHTLPKALPEEDEDFDTVNGLMNFVFAKIPDEGEVTEYAGYRFEILQSSRHKVELVKFTLLEESEKAKRS